MEAEKQPHCLMRLDLWLLIVLGLLGIVFFFAKFDESFPSASIDLRLSRPQLVNIARQWSQKLEYDDKAAITSIVFTYDDDAKTFLEYELGQSKANELMRKQIPIWMWQARFCKPFQIEEMTISLSPDGRLIGIRKSLPNEMAMPSIAHDKALTLARDFVEKSVGVNLSGMKLIKDSEEKQAHRTDHYFNWEDEQHDFKDGHLRYDVYVSGDKVTGFSQELHVPEKFTRKYAEIRSYNDMLKRISSIIYILLSSAITFIFVWAFVSGRIRWKFALATGVIAAALSIGNWIDGWPSLVNSYQTTMSFDQFVGQNIFSMILSSLYAAVAAVVFVGALEPIYRLAFPEKTALEKIPTACGLRSAPVFQALIAGLAVFGIHTAYVVAFYLFGNSIGFWSPLEVRETSTLSGLWPAFSAMNVGVNASTMEELMYRVLALVIFRRLTRNFWIANLLQAASWAFMHSDYPQEPAYARGIELTIGGFFYGYILKRYGLLSCVLAHFTYDAFLGVTPLISSPSWTDKLSALMAVWPGPAALIISAFLIKRNGTYEPVDQLTNHALSPPKPPAALPHGERPAPFDYTPASKRSLILCAIGAVVAMVIVVLMPMRTVGTNDKVHLSKDEAVRIARAYLLNEGFTTKNLKVVAYLADEDDDLQLQYVLEKKGFKQTKELAKALSPRLSWKVHFFKELDPEQFYVAIDPDGKVLAQWVLEDEDTRGAKLEQPEARKLAEGFLQQTHPEYAPYVFDDATKHEQKNRNDYAFTFRNDKLHVGEAEFKITTGIVGKYVSSYNRSWDVPDKWLYDREKVTLKDNVLQYLRWTFFVAASIASLWWLVQTLRKAHIEWRWPITLGAMAAATTLLSKLNGLPALFLNYSTDVKLNTFITDYVTSNISSLISAAAFMGVLVAFALAAYPQIFPDVSFPMLVRSIVSGDRRGFEGKRRLWLDGLIVGYSITAILGGISYLFDGLSYFTSPAVHTPPISGVVSASIQWSPALGALIDGLSAGVVAAFGALVSAAVLRHYFCRSFWKLFALTVVTGLITFTSLRYWQDYAWNAAEFIVEGCLAYWFITSAARRNPLAYMLAGYSTSLATVAWALARNGWKLYYADVYLMCLALCAPIVYVLWLYWGPRKLADSSQTAADTESFSDNDVVGDNNTSFGTTT